MKQVFQNMTTGSPELIDVPSPMSKEGELIIAATKSLISKGTEKMLTDFGKSSLIGKALKNPEKVKLVLDKLKTEGLVQTIESVYSGLNQPMKIGYCHVGRVLDNGKTDFSVGDRVVSNASHGEVVRTPYNLTARIPENVDDDSAVYTVLGSIALQGVRLISPTLGETVVVTGLGLIGLITVQILKANGCKVVGIDLDNNKCELAKGFGAEVVNISKGENPVDFIEEITKGVGVDAVLITASSKSNDVMHQAASMCRKRGKIVLVGVVGLELKREDFYEKELSFQVSCSYGPGRYDANYEDHGIDYPIGFVRWTEQRNFETVLSLLSDRSIDVRPLITHRFDLDNIKEAYSKLEDESSLGIILEYQLKEDELSDSRNIRLPENKNTDNSSNANKVKVSFIGAGNYASRVLMPGFKNNKTILSTVVTSEGSSGMLCAKKYGFEYASTDVSDALKKDSDILVIATRHNLHAEQIILGLEKQKNIFVEKPLALTHKEIDNISATYNKIKQKPLLMVGFNRRFSPHISKMKSLLASKKAQKCFIFTMNAGFIPEEHWTQDSRIGGGRIIGEACHYIDLMRYLADSPFKTWSAIKIENKDTNSTRDDRAIINLEFEDGSIGSIHYLSNGGPFQKERLEVFCENSVLQLNNFKTLRGYGWKTFNKYKTFLPNKGQNICIKKFIESVRLNTESPIPFSEIIEVSRITIDIAQSLRDQK